MSDKDKEIQDIRQFLNYLKSPERKKRYEQERREKEEHRAKLAALKSQRLVADEQRRSLLFASSDNKTWIPDDVLEAFARMDDISTKSILERFHAAKTGEQKAGWSRLANMTITERAEEHEKAMVVFGEAHLTQDEPVSPENISVLNARLRLLEKWVRQNFPGEKKRPVWSDKTRHEIFRELKEMDKSTKGRNYFEIVESTFEKEFWKKQSLVKLVRGRRTKG